MLDLHERLGPQRSAILARLPPALAGLLDLAYDVWWTWHPAARELLTAVDAQALTASGGDVLDMLRLVAPERLARLSEDADFLARLSTVREARERDLSAPATAGRPASPAHPIAFFCSEFALHASIPIYAGGLGVLAGDMLKEASDRALPMVGVGLLYHRGYFHQRLDPSGWQHEYWEPLRPGQLPAECALTPGGEPVRVSIELGDHLVHVRVLRVQVGRVPLYLLDTNLSENGPVDRFITAQLYSGDARLRLLQYLVLGVGGLRALRALGIDPAVLHLNEGHPAFATLELLRERLAAGRSLGDALRETQERVVFTTHTPVASGNESYAEADLTRALGAFLATSGLDAKAVLALGQNGSDASEPFGMTQLALRMARSVNGVSQQHGRVARAMWHALYPQHTVETVPIKHVTNGVHLPTWMAPAMQTLLRSQLGDAFGSHATDPWSWAALERIPDEALWAVRCQLRRELVDTVRARSVDDRLARGENLDYVEMAAHAFDPDVLTVGFARRVASYKRLGLLTGDAGRALALIGGERPIQVVIAGKAHPRDEGAKHLVQQIFAMKQSPLVGARVAFLEDYDLGMAARLVAGCDVWLNLPRPPLEASGTSGMKAILNGSLHLSVLDGWWHEAYDGENGWAIDSEQVPDTALQDARDADRLYAIMEREVVPMFYARDERGVPREWVARIRASMMSLGPRFNAGRMLQDYVSSVYRGTAA